ncbi:MAG: hypothetical protein GPJ52_04570 [Candidatus Heimdallarchaeota archaeon]|nr:hypothetical protein [Candidatus Heimdallarchaeota archaeon]
MTEEKKEEIRKIIAKHIVNIGDKFDDWLIHERYDQETFLTPGFKPTKEDFEIRNQYAAQEYSYAVERIKKIDEVINILEDLAQNESNPDIKKWASRIVQEIKRK